MSLILNASQMASMAALHHQHPQIGTWLQRVARRIQGERVADAEQLMEILLIKATAFDEYSAAAADSLIGDLLSLERAAALKHDEAQRFTTELERFVKQRVGQRRT